jgi:hypothetical protein
LREDSSSQLFFGDRINVSDSLELFTSPNKDSGKDYSNNTEGDERKHQCAVVNEDT